MRIPIYRGVHANHPALAAARLGEAVPGDANGKVTPAQHNAGGCSGHSPYTSWTHDRRIAADYARRCGHPGGVVLETLQGPPPTGAQWVWEYSPDIWGEQEVLLRGIRTGLKVTPP